MQTILSRSVAYPTLRIAAGVAVLFVASQLSIPWTPVPLNFEAVTALLLALLLNRRESLSVIALYLSLGAMGFPMFAEFSSGPHVLLGPTGGYLLGYLPAAFIANLALQTLKRRNVVTCFIATLLGSAVLFTTGVAQLSHFVGWTMAYQTGLVPFLVVEPIKMVFVALIAARKSNGA